MKNNILPRTCRSCGNEFMGGPRAWYCPACRVKRKSEADKRMRESRKAKDYVPLGTVIQCELCGKDIVKNSGRQKYCEECAKRHLKEVDNQQSLTWKKSHPEKIKEGKRELSRRRHKEDGKQSGIKYIKWDKGSRKWRVAPYINGKQIYLGRFADLTEAEEKLQEFLKEETQKSL